MVPKISWRSDAEYFSISFIDVTTNSRKFQVYTREGLLHSKSESVGSIESVIVWKNSRDLIASSIHRANKHEIIFFEPNGLSHGGFPLPFSFKKVHVKQLLWSNDSNILCVWSENLPGNDAEPFSQCMSSILLSIKNWASSD